MVATRIGRGGQPGQPRPQGVRKFMVEFIGGPLANLPFGVKPEPVLTSPQRQLLVHLHRGRARRRARPLARAVRPHGGGLEPVDMRLYLRNGNQTLSETWLYQFQPF